MSFNISLRDEIHNITTTNNIGVNIMKNAYKVAYKLHVICLVYHRLYNMHVDINNFKNLLNGYNSLPERMDEDAIFRMNPSRAQIESLRRDANNCYNDGMYVNGLTYKLMDKVHEYEDAHGLMRFELNQMLVYENMGRITDPEHIEFINEYEHIINDR